MLVSGDGMTIYLDQVWFLNSLVDYLLLAVSGELLGLPRRRRRLLLSGMAGGVYGALSLLPGLSYLGSVPGRLLAGAALCAGAFGAGKGLIRQTVVLFLLAAAFSGVTLLLTEVFSAPAAMLAGQVYYPLSTGTLILTAGGGAGLLSWGLGRLTQHGGNLVEVELTIGGKTKALTALRDTGNTLRDPLTGQRVLVTGWRILAALCPELPLSQGDFEHPETLLQRLRLAAPELSPRLIPYKTVGVSHGMLLALRPERITIAGKEEHLLAAFSPVAVSDGGGYSALLGGIR